MEEKDALLAVQERDIRIKRLEKQLDEMPEKRAILAARAKIEQIRVLLSKTERLTAAAAADVKRIEDETVVVSEKMEVEQAKLLSGEITAPKELQNISMELDGLRRRKEQLENTEMASLSRQQAAEADTEKVRAAIGMAEEREKQLVEVFKARGSAVLAELEKVRAERAALLAHLSADLAERYETVRASKHGIGAALLEEDTCGVCRVSVSAGKLTELLEGPPIGECPHCGRLLVVERDS